MAHDDWSGKAVLVLGLGDTGLSCVRWLAEKGARLRAADTRQAPPALGEVRKAVPGIRVDLGPFAIESLAGVVFLLGNSSWMIRAVRGGEVINVTDARGAPPTVPFWLGEAPGRTIALSQ